MSGPHRLEVFDDIEEVHKRGAELIAEAARAAVSEHGSYGLAVSGGADPWPMFTQLEDLDMDWTKTEIFQVDERVAPAGDDQRNLTHLVESLSIGAQGSIRPMPVTAEDLDAAADRYAESLPEALDLAHLGIGPDGHTASLVPGDPVLEVTDKRVAVTSGEYQGVRRMTLTYPELHRVRSLLWIITGEEKVDALQKLLAQDPSVPAGRVEPGGDSLILADRAAAPDA
ncbi:MAG TPA: 6-phosphogluconolactonase [Solirubrobacterales bacterium]|jgi:6-phosphogluconolactonase|nr:6-phosphogluconolactonase [Solirubrobacterales bacterium]